MILGIHCSIRGGYLAALEEARSLGCAAMQMFAYRRHREPGAEELEAFRKARAESPVARLLVHVRYVPFLASRDPERQGHSVRLLARELLLARSLDAEALVLHAGAYSAEEDLRTGLERVADGVRRAVEEAGTRLPVLIENVPGGGRRMGGALEELAELGALLERRKVAAGFCLDTAHAWAQGYDIATSEGMWRFLGQAHRRLGAQRIRAFHLNDTRALLGSRREHHWHWGRGRLGTEGLKTLLGRDEFREVPGILETPKDGSDRENLELVRGLTV